MLKAPKMSPDKLSDAYKKQSEDKEIEPEVVMEEARICMLRVCRKWTKD